MQWTMPGLAGAISGANSSMDEARKSYCSARTAGPT